MLWWRDERGVSIIEGGLWISLVLLCLAVVGVSFAETIHQKFEQVGDKLEVVTVPPFENP